MKLKIGNYNVEITAKDPTTLRSNEDDTMYLLNDIAIWAYEASIFNYDAGYKNSAKNCENRWRDISDFLKNNGFFDPPYPPDNSAQMN